MRLLRCIGTTEPTVTSPGCLRPHVPLTATVLVPERPDCAARTGQATTAIHSSRHRGRRLKSVYQRPPHHREAKVVSKAPGRTRPRSVAVRPFVCGRLASEVGAPVRSHTEAFRRGLTGTPIRHARMEVSRSRRLGRPGLRGPHTAVGPPVLCDHQPSSPSSSWNVPVGPSLPMVAIRTILCALIWTGRPWLLSWPPSPVAV